jgi:hypothetical protein
MQEIELQQGFFTPRVDGRGIERLRFLAMQFEGMGKTKVDVSLSSLIQAQRLNKANGRRAALLTTHKTILRRV